ncbi:DUF4283 domain protein [Trifolium medium]|uniref:DUF4283 domain protein n=1 Tax=Trifolium medium TaxID=97028 RepID=A0A392M9W7_9FABA|nr:DUF4283 domain protein [Trifolium medium]
MLGSSSLGWVMFGWEPLSSELIFLVLTEKIQGRRRQLMVETEQVNDVAVVAPVLEVGQMVNEVVWEVEVETEVLKKLKGAYVGFLAKRKDYFEIQQNFIMDGYHNIRVSPLGHMKVLISSVVEGEVQEVVGTVGWWCTWFDRFEEWSPDLVSNQRTTWVQCFGIPHHAWGEAIFRALTFKFGTFVEVDTPTKDMLRFDVARIKLEGGEIGDDGLKCCGGCTRSRDGGGSSRGSVDGGSVMAVVEGLQGGRKRQHIGTRLEEDQTKEGSELKPNLLGNTLVVVSPKVNCDAGNNLDFCEGSRGDGDKALESVRMLEKVHSVPSRSHDLDEGEREQVGLDDELTCEAASKTPTCLRTKGGEISILLGQMRNGLG